MTEKPKVICGVDPGMGPDQTAIAVIGRVENDKFELISVDLIKAENVVYPHPTGSILCNKCGGSGTEVLFQFPRDCPTCEGTGWQGGKARVATANIKYQLKKPAEHITLNFAVPGSWAWAQEQMKDGKKVRRKAWHPALYKRTDESLCFILCEKDRDLGELIHLDTGDTDENERATDWELFKEPA